MTHDTRSTDAIERDIAQERAKMTDTIEDLKQKFSIDAILTDLSNMVRGQGGNLGRTISHTVGRNPAAVAVIGLGLAWLYVGQDRHRSAQPSGRRPGPANRHRTNRPKFAVKHSVTDGTGSSRDQDDDHDWYWGTSQDRPGQGQGWQTSHGDGSDTPEPSGGITGAIRSGASAAADAVSDAAGSLAPAASRLTERLSVGLETLSDEARERVLTARRAAHDARNRGRETAARAGRAASGFHDEMPLVTGALAMALGAAIAAALPHSRLEDDNLGESSDRLYAKAQAMFREEREKAMAVLHTAASDVRDEVKAMGNELADLLPEGKSVGDVIVDRTAQAANRVVDRAIGSEPDRKQDHDSVSKPNSGTNSGPNSGPNLGQFRP